MTTRTQSAGRWIIFALFVLVTCAGAVVHAAEVSFGEIGDVRVDDEFEIPVVFDTEGVAVNAIEGEIGYPSSLELVRITTGNSPISFWLEQPHAEQTGEIVFSGIMPGGYSGKGAILRMVFKARAVGSHEVVIAASALRNDGRGTKLSVVPRATTVDVFESTGVPRIVSVPADREAPESFRPEIATDPNILDGKHFVVFSTTDKSSGIVGYTLYETRWNVFFPQFGSWREAESPAVLRDQTLQSYVYIRARDAVGNIRTEIIPPQTRTFVTVLYTVLAVCLVMLATGGAILFLKRLKHKSSRKT